MDIFDRVLPWGTVLLMAVVTGLVALVFWYVAVGLAAPGWSAKHRHLAGLGVLPEAELADLFRRARAPLNRFFRLLGVAALVVMAVTLVCVTIDFVLIQLPLPVLSSSETYTWWVDFRSVLLSSVLTTPAIFGLWLLFKARSVQASQEIERLHREANNLPKTDNPDLVSVLRPGASRGQLRGFGAGLILMAIYLSHKHFPAVFTWAKQAVLGLVTGS